MILISSEAAEVSYDPFVSQSGLPETRTLPRSIIRWTDICLSYKIRSETNTEKPNSINIKN